MSAAEGIRVLEERVAAAPAAVGRTLAAPAPALPRAWARLPVVATGLGGSQAAARLLAARLRECPGRAACFRPMNAFYSREPANETGVLVVFSQGLSPNARIALAHADAFDGLVLVTSVTEAGLREAGKSERLALLQDLRKRGAVIWPHPPENEYTILPRVVGPVCAAVAALRLAEGLGGPSAAPPAGMGDGGALAAIGPSAEERRALAAEFVAGVDCNFTNGAVEYAHNLAAKAVEGLFAPTPVCRDLLEYAHGPFQQQCVRGRPQWILRSATAPEAALAAAVAPLFGAPGVGARPIVAPYPAPWALVYWELYLNALLPEAARIAGVDLATWPGKGADGPAYAIDTPYRGRSR